MRCNRFGSSEPWAALIEIRRSTRRSRLDPLLWERPPAFRPWVVSIRTRAGGQGRRVPCRKGTRTERPRPKGTDPPRERSPSSTRAPSSASTPPLRPPCWRRWSRSCSRSAHAGRCTIHDGLTQSVTSAILELQALRHRIETDPADAIASLHEIEDAIRDDLSEIREVLFELDAGTLSRGPVVRHVRPRAGRALEAAGARHDRGRHRRRAGARAGDRARVVGEALANAAKHSGSEGRHREGRRRAGHAPDRGRQTGAAASRPSPTTTRTSGSDCLQARVHEIGGSLEIESTPGRGVRVVAVLPVGGQGEAR